MSTSNQSSGSVINRNTLAYGVVIFAVAFVVRVAFIVVAHPYHDLARYELERTAISLATTGVYGNPYAIPTGPTAHVSPGYTVLLAGLFRLFGTGVFAEIIKELLATFVTSLACGLLPFVANNLNISQRAGVLAGFFSALLPLSPLVQVDGDWEAPYTALALMLVCVLTARLWRNPDLTARNAVLHGVSWGVSLLFVSALGPLFGVFLLCGVFFCRQAGLDNYLKFAAIQFVVAVLCLSPWIVRNEHALGAPVWSRTNLGIELRVSNNDFAGPDQRVNSLNGVYNRYHPLQNADEAAKVRNLGEVAYNKQATSDAKSWIQTHPERFAQLCLGHLRDFWFYPDPSRVKALLLGAIVLIGFLGLVFEWQENRTTAVILTLVLLIYPLPNYLIHVGVRQQYPINWIMILLCAALITKRVLRGQTLNTR